jgi:long-chain acyl-CoA synthetase
MPADLAFEEQSLAGDALLDRGRRLAGGLYRLGIREGDTVALLMRNAPEYLDVMHACRIAGCMYCPINWHFMPAEIEYLLKDSGAKAIISDIDLLSACMHIVPAGVTVLTVNASGAAASASASALPGSLDYAQWLAGQTPYDGPVVSPRAHIAYTSGTTGRPKGVIREPVPLADLAAREKQMQEVVARTFGIVPGCRALLPAPLYHSAPTLFARSALQTADLLVLTQRFDALRVLSLVERYRIDTLYLVPIMYVRLLKLSDEERARYDLSSLRFIASTGAPCSPDVKRAMIEWLGPIIYETYASSEVGMVTVIDSHDALARPGSAGRPVVDARVKIYRESGEPCGVGEVGLIYARQPAYPDFTYRNNEAARERIERDGLVTLGDMGYLDAHGYLYVCDRASDMVISGGVNIYPAEIENVLARHPAISDSAVFGVPDHEYGERLVAVVECDKEAAALSAAELIDWLRPAIAGYKIPREIDFVERLPRDDNGKIAKRRLRDAYVATSARA